MHMLKKKSSPVRGQGRGETILELLLGDSTHGAGVSAGAALDAGGSVDLELGIALGDSADGAAALAGTAHNAVRADNISHSSIPLFQNSHIVSHFADRDADQQNRSAVPDSRQRSRQQNNGPRWKETESQHP